MIKLVLFFSIIKLFPSSLRTIVIEDGQRLCAQELDSDRVTIDGTVFNDIIKINALIELSGKGKINGNRIAIKANQFLFSGTIECNDSCNIEYILKGDRCVHKVGPGVWKFFSGELISKLEGHHKQQ